MIYMWFIGINYYKLAVEKDRDSIFTTMWKPGSKTIYFQISCRHTCLKHMEGSLQNNYGLTTAQYGRQMIRTLEFKNLLNSPIFLTMATSSRNDQTCMLPDGCDNNCVLFKMRAGVLYQMCDFFLLVDVNEWFELWMLKPSVFEKFRTS